MPITEKRTLYFNYNSETIEVDPNNVEILTYNQEEEEYVKYDNNEVVDLYKKGNRKIWQYKICQGLMTDAEFNTLRFNFEKMNGFVVTFDPHYDSGTAGYQCYIEFYFDDCNAFPAKVMDLNIVCIDYTDREL